MASPVYQGGTIAGYTDSAAPPGVARTVDNPGDGTFTPVTPNRPQIEEQLRQEAQGSIDAINQEADQAVADAKKAGEERLGQDNATSVLSGLMGSTEAARTHNVVTAANDKELQAIYAKRAADLGTVYGNLGKAARDEYNQQVADATKTADQVAARRAQVQQDAISNLKLMASGGLVDYQAFKSNPANADVYNHALSAVGGSEDALRSLFATNRPQDQLLGSPVRVGDHYVQAYKNPITGKVNFDTVQVPGGLPPEYKSFQTIGGNIVAVPDNWDGDLKKLVTVGQSPAAYKAQTTPSPGTGGVSPELEQAIQNGTIDPNKVNSRTLAIYNDLAKAQVDAAGSHATIAGNTKAYEDATRYATTATRVIGVIDKNMPLVAALADKVNQTGIPGLDTYIAGVKSYTGNNPDVVKYINSIKTMRSEYAQMLARGGTVTEADKSDAAQAIPTGLSGDNYTSLAAQLKLEGQNIIDTANETKNSLFKSTQAKGDNGGDTTGTSNNDPLGLGI
jgi:hypothetical protein